MADSQRAAELAQKLIAAEARLEKEKRQANANETRRRQQAASDEKTKRDAVAVAWRELRNAIKKEVAAVNKSGRRELISIKTTPSYEIHVGLTTRSRTMVLSVNQSTGIVQSSGFNGGEFSLRDSQFNPAHKAGQIIEALCADM